MSAHNLGTHLEEMTISTPTTSGKAILWNDGAPAGGESGYAKGCIWVNCLGNSTTTRLYVNGGTNSSASWISITTQS